MRFIKYAFFFLVLLVLAFSPIQLRYSLLKEAPLKGFYKHREFPSLKFFTWRRWFPSAFQDEFSNCLNDNIGMRNSLIRLNNQFDYSLFSIIHNKGFIQGCERYLYEEDYLHEYNGNSFIGEAVIYKKLARLKNVIDSLNAHHIPLLLIYEPGKASFYPEYIPRRFHPEKRSQNNFDCFLQYSHKLGLPFMDMNSYFQKVKDTSHYPLFPRYGMHWSIYGVSIAVDTLNKSIETATGRGMPKFKIQKVIQSPIPLGTDNDIGEMLNLACPLRPTPGAYPRISFDTSPSRSLSALIIADSYYINIAEAYGRKLFRNQEYWYYNNKIYPYQNHNPPPYVDKSNLREKLKKFDVILLMVSEINLHCGFWNFADEAFLAFHPEIRDDHVYTNENQIRNERSWFKFLVQKAKSLDRPLDEMIRNDAEYTFFNNYNEIPEKIRQDSIIHLVLSIQNNGEWLSAIRKKALERNVSLDTMLYRDANYLYDQSKQNH